MSPTVSMKQSGHHGTLEQNIISNEQSLKILWHRSVSASVLSTRWTELLSYPTAPLLTRLLAPHTWIPLCACSSLLLVLIFNGMLTDTSLCNQVGHVHDLAHRLNTTEMFLSGYLFCTKILKFLLLKCSKSSLQSALIESLIVKNAQITDHLFIRMTSYTRGKSHRITWYGILLDQLYYKCN